MEEKVMPVYMYRAISKSGQVVTNRVEDTSKYNLIKKLKRNNLTPISVVQRKGLIAKQNHKKRSARNMDRRIEEIIAGNNRAKKNKNVTISQKLNLALAGTEKITIRDVMIFTQNFYLLKKANFNNIHALSTIIESTENLTFRAILEDI